MFVEATLAAELDRLGKSRPALTTRPAGVWLLVCGFASQAACPKVSRAECDHTVDRTYSTESRTRARQPQILEMAAAPYVLARH